MTVKILHGNCFDVLQGQPDRSVDCCVTSPPYWGLRDYGTPPQSWPAITYSPLPGLPPLVEIPAMECSLGLEPTLEAFIGHMVLVFREVRRVLKDEGTLWMNMGDSYAGSRAGPDTGSTLDGSRANQAEVRKAKQAMTASRRRDDEPIPRNDVRVPGLKPKDMVGQPWRLALALQADGWWLRQDVIWGKPNPMPESARDRCTKAHEYLFLLAKSERYYWDFEAMQETASDNTHPRRAATPYGWATGEGKHEPAVHQQASEHLKARNNGVGFGHGFDKKVKPRVVGRKDLPAGQAKLGAFRDAQRKLADKEAGRAAQGLKEGEAFGRAPGWRTKSNASFDEAMAEVRATRNRRTVWMVATEPFKEAHFATFPPGLIEPCIKASCPPGGVVLDPFGGAGTTGLVADRLQRNALLVELNPTYIGIAERRIVGDAPLFAEVE